MTKRNPKTDGPPDSIHIHIQIERGVMRLTLEGLLCREDLCVAMKDGVAVASYPLSLGNVFIPKLSQVRADCRWH